jgi:trimethylamine corrinoid protein
MTTTLASIVDLMNALRESGLNKDLKTIIGGAATNQAFAEECGADYWGKDASDGVTKIAAIIKERRG